MLGSHRGQSLPTLHFPSFPRTVSQHPASCQGLAVTSQGGRDKAALELCPKLGAGGSEILGPWSQPHR